MRIYLRKQEAAELLQVPLMNCTWSLVGPWFADCPLDSRFRGNDTEFEASSE